MVRLQGKIAGMRPQNELVGIRLCFKKDYGASQYCINFDFCEMYGFDV